MFHHRILAALCAAALTFGVAGMAAADTVTETLTVASSISLSGVPASIAYSTAAPGVASPNHSFGITVASNVPWQILLSGTDFSGPGVMTKHAREVEANTLNGMTSTISAFTPFDALSAPELSGGVTAAATGVLVLHILAPLSATAGDYTGSFDVVISAS